MDPIRAILNTCDQIRQVSPWLLLVPHGVALGMMLYAVAIRRKVL